MLCEKCQKGPATVHVTRIINGKKTEANLCDICAQEENNIGFGEPTWMLHNIFADLFNQPVPGSHVAQEKREETVRCEQCGFTDAQFSKVGKLGCPKCYEVFENKLEPVLRRVHGNPVHMGKIPKRTGGTIGLRKEIEGLKLELKAAINREEYEKAAKIRDEIRSLEKKLG
ncbi:UvrB/UvrC motif-containing protein [Phosphitispora sp. TUW77]|uniref:UvrB/UvrC motif-containing protein n=1 Tax=Phosphitispora sp. TUW77 TaxID=3152361 RepID=UPI003AB1BC86